MIKAIADWHKHFVLQAGWTFHLRNYLLSQIDLPGNARVLEVGCGTGALLSDSAFDGYVMDGIDLDLDRLRFCDNLISNARVINADGYHLPIQDEAYDLVFSHYLLLWCKQPLDILKEMLRVCKKGGYVMCFGEPDYTSRIDFPQIFQKLGRLQNHSLEFQGVNLSVGRQMGDLLIRSGLSYVHTGVMGFERMKQSIEDFEDEWAMIAYDLGGLVPLDEILAMREEARRVWMEGRCTLFIPTFYGYGIRS